MTIYLANAFSLSMLPFKSATIKVKEVSVEEVKQLLTKHYVSAVGHESTAQLLSQLLSINVPVNRTAITLKPRDVLIVFQLLTRLPEGKVLSIEEIQKLPFKFYVVEVVEAQ
jgi:Domain of unknown function (DUF1874).